jgi:hypothetical protein
MRRTLAFGVLAGPALAWVPVSVWLRAHVGEWVASGTELPLPIRIGLAIDHHVVRLLPFAVIATLLAMPFLAWGASFLASTSFESNVRALLVWTVFGYLFALPLLILVLLHRRHWVSALAPLMWADIVTYAIALGAGFAVQRQRYQAGTSSWRARTVLWVGTFALLLKGLGPFYPIMLWYYARRDLRRAGAA